MSAEDADAPLLEMRGISKSFPGVRALHRVDLDLRSGEVLALLGENGAGKSTLIKMLGGAHQTGLQVSIHDSKVRNCGDLSNPTNAIQARGIGGHLPGIQP